MSRPRRGRRTRRSFSGVILTLIFVAVILGVIVFIFTGDSMTGLKGKVYSLLYPQKYSQEVERSAAEFHVDKNLLYAVIRTESGFRPEVESHAGAVGLMQLMPSTFEWLQESLDGEITHDVNALTDPDINVRYGAYFLSMLLDDYGGNIRTAAAAYNAGFVAVDGWLEDPAYSPDGRTLTAIPYEETANYADKVEEAYEMYQKIYG